VVALIGWLLLAQQSKAKQSFSPSSLQSSHWCIFYEEPDVTLDACSDEKNHILTFSIFLVTIYTSEFDSYSVRLAVTGG